MRGRQGNVQAKLLAIYEKPITKTRRNENPKEDEEERQSRRTTRSGEKDP